MPPLWAVSTALAVAVGAVALVALSLGGGGLPEAGLALDRDAGALLAACGSCIGLQWLVRHAPAAGAGRWRRLQLTRRVQHATTGVLIAALYAALPWRLAAGGLATGFTALFLLQVLRGASENINAQFLAAFGDMLKEEERQGAPPAALGFLGGVLLCAVCFPQRVCIASVLGAALGDPAAAVAGQLLGGPRLLGRKTLAGSAACFAVAGACGGAVAAHAAASCTEGAVAASAVQAFALCGSACAAAELLGGGIGPMHDDNFCVIFGTGALLWALRFAAAAAAPLAGGPGTSPTALEILFGDACAPTH